MFERKILEDLQRWRIDSMRKPLVLRGARQVGKTTAVNQFGKTFANYLYLNCENRTVVRLFESEVNTSDLVELFFAHSGKKMHDGETLIFIDEIQNSPAAMARLRYFYEERPDLFVIAAGSLLENVVDLQQSFPVGRVQFLAMRPCSFVEFATALGKSSLLSVLKSPEHSTIFHAELLQLFQRYTLVGGMPEIVQRYANKPDLKALDTSYESLVQSYKDDVEKYVRRSKLIEVVRFILQNGWSKTAEIVTLGRFANSEYNSREVREAFLLLQKAMLLELAYPTTATCVPALPETKRMPKLIWLDVGLVNYQAGNRNELIHATDVLDVWRGKVAEQIVAQELLTLDSRVSAGRTFWVKGKGIAEVDFLYNFQGKLVPIEVKNGHNAHLRSLHVFMQNSPSNVAVRIWSQPFSVDEICVPQTNRTFKLINLPFYLINQLDDILANFA